MTDWAETRRGLGQDTERIMACGTSGQPKVGRGSSSFVEIALSLSGAVNGRSPAAASFCYSSSAPISTNLIDSLNRHFHFGGGLPIPSWSLRQRARTTWEEDKGVTRWA